MKAGGKVDDLPFSRLRAKAQRTSSSSHHDMDSKLQEKPAGFDQIGGRKPSDAAATWEAAAGSRAASAAGDAANRAQKRRRLAATLSASQGTHSKAVSPIMVPIEKV